MAELVESFKDGVNLILVGIPDDGRDETQFSTVKSLLSVFEQVS